MIDIEDIIHKIETDSEVSKQEILDCLRLALNWKNALESSAIRFDKMLNILKEITDAEKCKKV